MGYWTLKYFADPVNAPNDFVEKIWDDASGKGWGIGKGKLQRRSFDVDEFTFTADGQAIDSPPLFVFGSKIIVLRDRTLDNNGFSGGTIYFQGLLTNQRRVGTHASENVFYTVSGPWWYLKQDCYEQVFFVFGSSTHIILNFLNGSFLSVGSQIKDILDNALSKFGSIFSYSIGSELNNTFPPTDEKKCLTYAEALRSEIKWSPRTVSWFDYSQIVPVLHFQNILTLSTVTLDLSAGVQIVSEDIVPRYDLQISQVIFNYEKTNTVDNSSFLKIDKDVYPPTTTDKIGIMRATVDLQGIKGTEQFATITTQDLILNAVTNPSNNIFDWWTDKHPELLDSSPNTLKIHDIIIDSSGQNLSQRFEIVEGSFHVWMKVGNVDSGALGIQQDVHVKALVDYTDQFGHIIQNHPIQVKVKTTNLPSNTYSRLKITALPEPTPVGLAQFFFNSLNVLQWEGDVVVEGEEVSPQQFLGCNLNLSNGLPDWATMLATVNSVVEDLDEGSVSVRFGPNKFLSPEEIVDLLRVIRARQWTFYTQTAQSGNLGNEDVQSPDNLGKENSSKGLPKFNKDIISFKDPVTTEEAKLTSDAINKSLSLETNNPASGSVQLNLADLVANDKLNP